MRNGADSREAMLERLSYLLERDFGIAARSINEGSDLVDDLGIDSLRFTELTLVIEEEFGLALEAGDFQDVTTLGAALDVIEAMRQRA